jgi:predicted nucleotidyltransferase
MSTVENLEESVISDVEKKHLSEKLRDESAHLLLLSAHGSHLYGWAGTGSDMDLRGVYLADTRRKLGIRGHPADSILLPHSLDVDVEIHEVGKVIHEALKGNCNFLEFIHAPHLVAGPEGRELADLLWGNFSKSGFYNSYRGLAYHNYNKYIRGKATKDIEYDPFTEEWLNKTMTMREFLSHPDGFFRKEFERIKAWAKPKGKEPIKPTCKKYLYVYRSLMTAEVMFNTGEFVFDIRELNNHFDYPEVDLLLGAKMKEKEALPADHGMDPVQLDGRINHLFGTMEAAYKASKLPDGPEPEVLEKLNNFIIGLRLDN